MQPSSSASSTSGPSSSFIPERQSQTAATASGTNTPPRTVTAGARAVSLVASTGPANLQMALSQGAVARCLSQVLPSQDLLNLHQSLAPDSQAHKVLGRQASVPDAHLQQAGLKLAVDGLSRQQTPEDQQRLYRLFDTKQLEAFFDQEIAARYAHCGLPLPDPVNDDPLTFVSKCQAIDKSDPASLRCTFSLLERALETANVPVAFTLLKGLQCALHQGCLERSSLEDLQGRTLLEGTLFYEKLSLDWCRLVLAAGVLDAGPDTPLCRAVFLSRDSAALEALLEAGADPSVPDNIMGALPQLLCIQGFCAAGRQKLEALLRHPRVDPNQISGSGPYATTLLHQAVSSGRSELVSRLLQHKAIDVDVFCAACWGSPLAAAVVSFLISHNSPRHPGALCWCSTEPG